jgi:uncharacterized protein YcfJ
MRKSLLPRITVMTAALIAALPAFASDYTDTARVVSSTPIMERVREPRLECTPEAPPPQNAPQAERSVIGPIIGGVAGALLGNTVGRGSGRAAATAAGAIAGAIVGDHVGNQPVATAPAERCRSVETIRETVRGYTVVYQFNGRDITTTMAYDPGPTVRVGVTALDGAGVAAAAPITAAMAGSSTHEVIVERYREPARHLPPPPPPGYGY